MMVHNNTNTNNSNLLIFLAFIIVSRFSCTALSTIPVFNMTMTFMYNLLFILSLVYVNRKTGISYKPLSYLAFYILYVITIEVIIKREYFFNKHIFNPIIIFFLYFIFCYLGRVSKKIAQKICILSLVGLDFTYIYSIYILQKNPMLSRIAASAKIIENSNDILNGIGGFDTVYGAILVIIFCLFLVDKCVNKKMKIFLIITLISSIMFVVSASFGSAFIMLFVAFALRISKKNKFFAVVVLFFIIFIMINRVYFGNLLFVFSEKINVSYILKDKIKDISQMLITGKSAGTYSDSEGRLARMGWGIKCFLNHPIIGSGYIDGIQTGGHSEVFDTLGRYGLIGIVSYLLFWKSFLSLCKNRMCTKQSKLCFNTSVVAYVIISIINPSSYTQQVLPFFVLLPCFDYFCNDSPINS